MRSGLTPTRPLGTLVTTVTWIKYTTINQSLSLVLALDVNELQAESFKGTAYGIAAD